MAQITVIGTFADDGGHFSETVDATGSAEAERIVRRLLAPREIHIAGFFDYGSAMAACPVAFCLTVAG